MPEVNTWLASAVHPASPTTQEYTLWMPAAFRQRTVSPTLTVSVSGEKKSSRTLTVNRAASDAASR